MYDTHRLDRFANILPTKSDQDERPPKSGQVNE
jgi:hypothetical protein